MNESAPATLRVPVRAVERCAAGMLAAGWAGWVFWWGGGVMHWWESMLITLQGLPNFWQWVGTKGDWRRIVQPGSLEFAIGMRAVCRVFWDVGMLGLIVAVCWVVGAGERRRMRALFWLAVLGHGLLGLGWLAAEGRSYYVRYRTFSGPDRDPVTWYGGWLQNILSPFNTLLTVMVTGCVLAIFLSLAILWLRRRDGRRGKAGDGVAGGSLEGGGAGV